MTTFISYFKKFLIAQAYAVLWLVKACDPRATVSSSVGWFPWVQKLNRCLCHSVQRLVKFCKTIPELRVSNISQKGFLLIHLFFPLLELKQRPQENVKARCMPAVFLFPASMCLTRATLPTSL